MSVLSQKDAIRHWIDTPEGDEEGRPSYGNKIHLLLFSNGNDNKETIGKIVNWIVDDCGQQTAETILKIDILDFGIGGKYINIISYNNDEIVHNEVEINE